MKVLLFVIVFTINPLPPESQLMAALDSFYQLQIESDLAELNIKQKKKWLKYLPTVGVTYTLEGKPRPAISWSSALLYSSQKEKAQIIAKKQSIYKKNQLALEKDKLRLKGLLRKYQFLEQDIAFRQDLFEYDQQLYEIKKDRANKIEIPPSELLKGYSSLKEKGIRYFSKTKRTPRTRNSNINYRKIFLMKIKFLINKNIKTLIFPKRISIKSGGGYMIN